MTHWRTSRATIGGGQSRGSPCSTYSTRAADLEIVALIFSIAVIALPGVIVGGIYMAYLAFR